MEALPEYLNLFVNVTLENDGTVTCRPKELNIPWNAIATITWIPTANNFQFRAFRWCKSNGFLTQTPIVHEGCIISAVQNTKTESQGTFCYQLTVVAGNCEHSTPACPVTDVQGGGGTSNGQPKIKNQ
jgi:hypothetical protein